MRSIFIPLLAVIMFSCTGIKDSMSSRELINLKGEWAFALDPEDRGEIEKWFLAEFDDRVILPGTTDENKKGFLNMDTTTLHLNRVYTYEGSAWYQKKITVPESFRNKHIELNLERTKCSRIWVDSILIGSSRLLQTPQRFDVTSVLSPGEHTITIRVNNDRKLTPYGNVHIYSDDTQTNWNGILGDLFLEASSATFIKDIKVTPVIEERKIEIEVRLKGEALKEEVEVELQLSRMESEKSKNLKTRKFLMGENSNLVLEYELGDDCSLWDEYNQPLYELTVRISSGEVRDSKSVSFGMREFSVTGKQFSINGRSCFLRGKHEAAVFPLSGHTPMDTEEWLRVFRIAKSYGINHYRFHSYCPPEAAFQAADQLGIFLQPELPFWGGLDSDEIAEALLQEGYAMLDAYANHPSLVMFSHGNEIWSGHDRVEANIKALKAYDNRPLYTMGCNNGIGYIPPRECSEFYVGARTPYAYDTILTHLRLTQAFADSKDGAILNSRTPSTTVNFNYPVSQIGIPVISHEIGQYQIFPDFNEIEKYTGVLRAWNLEKFRDRLESTGMGSLDSIFRKASGVWSALCYKAEMEAALRTSGMAGFQLLDLQDFPGQGTALVGILDAFMDSKDVITPEKWKESCNDVVLLLEFEKYCWTNAELFTSTLKIANYCNRDLTEEIIWKAETEDGKTVSEGKIDKQEIPMGTLGDAGTISFNLTSLEKACKLNISCSIPGSAYKNNYSLWVYPDHQELMTGEVLVSEKLDKETQDKLMKGARVLYFPKNGTEGVTSISGLFPPDFWNWGMFKTISENNGMQVSPGTLGLLIDTEHPLLADFPTDFHTNWQWFSIIKNSNPLILDTLEKGYYPIVQVIDNMERNHKLGLIFEFSVGEGKLLICASTLNRLEDLPEARQLYSSILQYMNSGTFDPEYMLNREQLKVFLE